jgi:signal transduction histidine kinase
MPAEPVDVGQVVLDACQHGQRMRGDATFLGDHPALAGVTVCGNADYLRQALLILLDNAAKYTPPSGDVRVESVIEDGHVLISVVDTGIGITPHDLPHIFDRFYRGTTTNGATGTGLGLAIATWITEQHGGTLAVQSSPGAGSRFTLRLPLVPRATSG